MTEKPAPGTNSNEEENGAERDQHIAQGVVGIRLERRRRDRGLSGGEVVAQDRFSIRIRRVPK